jgi:hypothetical protein
VYWAWLPVFPALPQRDARQMAGFQFLDVALAGVRPRALVLRGVVALGLSDTVVSRRAGRALQLDERAQVPVDSVVLSEP